MKRLFNKTRLIYTSADKSYRIVLDVVDGRVTAQDYIIDCYDGYWALDSGAEILAIYYNEFGEDIEQTIAYIPD